MTLFLIYRSRNGYQQLIKHIDVMFFLGKYGWNHQLDTINSNSIGSGIGMGRMIHYQGFKSLAIWVWDGRQNDQPPNIRLFSSSQTVNVDQRLVGCRPTCWVGSLVARPSL